MLFTTPTQWVAVAIALIAGWLLGLASHPGGRKWRTRYTAERDAHAELRRSQSERIAELERENARLAAAPRTDEPVVVERAAGDPVAVERPLAADRAAAAYPADRHRL